MQENSFFIDPNLIGKDNTLSILLHTVEAFARVNYQSIYLIDFEKQDFLYVSDNPLFLCGYKAEDVKRLGYSFYLKQVPQIEQEKLVELKCKGFELFNSFTNEDKYKCSISCHFHLNSGGNKKLINHRLTPVLLTEEGKIWIGMCIVSLSSHKTMGHVEFRKKGNSHFWKYSFVLHNWQECDEILLKENEIEVLRLSAAGFTMKDIADKMFRSVDSVKFYKRNAFKKLGVDNIMEAIIRATLNKLF